ncbi:MAG: DUF4296 domain-containing protein [Bacteroidales bacterium]|nr:DUF4296 domain-containing protein [Bacteroidales bacterium]
MYRFALLIIAVTFILSCSESEEIKRTEILNDDVFLSLLIDLHKAEGIITASNIKLNRSLKDSISIYNYVLKKHNISRQDFNKTVKYYTFHTNKFLVIYDSVSSSLKSTNKELEQEIENEIKRKKEENLKNKDTLNLWKLKKEWKLPEDGEKNPIPYKILLKKHGQYKLQANIKIFPDDKSVNQRMTIIANYTDGTKDLNSVGTMVKDGKFEVYSVTVTTDKNKVLESISGWVLDHSKKTAKKHAHIKEISLKYIKKDSNNK